MHFKKGDTTKVMAGKDRGKTARVINVDKKNARISLEGLNLFKKHARPKKQGEKGEIVQVVRPISISNVMLVCSSCHKPTRVGSRIVGEKKIRYCKRCKTAF